MLYKILRPFLFLFMLIFFPRKVYGIRDNGVEWGKIKDGGWIKLEDTNFDTVVKEEKNKDQDEKDGGIGAGMIVLIICLSVLVLAGAGVAVYIFVIKPKKANAPVAESVENNE